MSEPPPFSYSVEAEGFSFQVVEPPLPPTTIDELMALWARPDVFGHAPDDGEEGTRAQLLGAEASHNRHVLYIARVVRQHQPLCLLCISSATFSAWALAHTTSG